MPVDTPYTFLPSPEVRLVRPPVVLSSLECGDNPTDPNEAAGLASKPTVQFCKVRHRGTGLLLYDRRAVVPTNRNDLHKGARTRALD